MLFVMYFLLSPSVRKDDLQQVDQVEWHYFFLTC